MSERRGRRIEDALGLAAQELEQPVDRRRVELRSRVDRDETANAGEPAAMRQQYRHGARRVAGFAHEPQAATDPPCERP